MHEQGGLSSNQVSEAVSSAFQENIHPLKQNIEEKFNLLTREVTTASSACSNKVSQVIRNNSEIGTTITKMSACQMEQSVKFDVMDAALVRIKQDLKNIQTKIEHTASNRAENTKKVASTDCNQAKMDTALKWMKQNLETIHARNEHTASNQAESTEKLASIDSNQTKMDAALTRIGQDLEVTQTRSEHTASKHTGKLASIDSNQTKMDAALTKVKQDLEVIQARS